MAMGVVKPEHDPHPAYRAAAGASPTHQKGSSGRRLDERRSGPRTRPSQGSRRRQGLMLIGRVRLLRFAPAHDQDRAPRMTEEFHGVAIRPEQPGPREPSSAGDYQ